MTARRLPVTYRSDARGTLGVAEAGVHVPFGIARLFFLTDLPAGAHRGGHAHRAQHQFLVVATGALTVRAEWPGGDAAWRLTAGDDGLHAPPLTWLDLTDPAPGTTVFVLASDGYDESDYIRDRGEFDRLRAAATMSMTATATGAPDA